MFLLREPIRFENKANLRDLTAATGLAFLPKIGFKSLIFGPRVTWKFDGWPRRTILILYYVKPCAALQSHRWIQTGVTVWKRSIRVKIDIFVQCDLKIWQITLKNNRAPILYYVKLCASFQTISEFKLELHSGNVQLGVKIGDFFLSHVTLKFDGWPWKPIGHILCATTSFVHHFIAICEFEMELQSGNAHFGSESVIFCPVWPWNLTHDLEKQ